MTLGRASVLLLAFAAACTQAAPPAPTSAPAASAAPAVPKASLGNVMAEVARRFEIAGRAADANRWELAEFEVGELEELFESDVPGAELPKEGPTAHIPAMAKAFLSKNAAELKRAAAGKDRAAFASAFRDAAAACNGCHQSSAKGFIQVPAETGKAVPSLEPLPAASAAAH